MTPVCSRLWGHLVPLRRDRSLVQRLGQEHRVQFRDPVPPDQLLALIHDADVILAPLKPNDRNCVQGCCPLKELGGMASGTPMITSALEIVEALGQSGKQFLTGRAGSAKAVKDNLLLLRTNSDWRLHLSAAARAQVEQFYAWETVTRSLIQVYEYLGLNQVPKA